MAPSWPSPAGWCTHGWYPGGRARAECSLTRTRISAVPTERSAPTASDGAKARDRAGRLVRLRPAANRRRPAHGRVAAEAGFDRGFTPGEARQPTLQVVQARRGQHGFDDGKVTASRR